jgi:hypothetical protein
VAPGPVTLEVQVTAPNGSVVTGASVLFNIFNGAVGSNTTSVKCSGLSDSPGYYSCSIDTTKFEYNSFSWYADAGKAGYMNAVSDIWTFSNQD